jgi:hypothetical protein
VAVELMHELRDRVVLPLDAEKGTRFNDDNHTLWVLESATKETEFVLDPAFHVGRALVESARSDHWYNHEKQYDERWYDPSDDGYDDNDDNFVEE